MIMDIAYIRCKDGAWVCAAAEGKFLVAESFVLENGSETMMFRRQMEAAQQLVKMETHFEFLSDITIESCQVFLDRAQSRLNHKRAQQSVARVQAIMEAAEICKGKEGVE